MPSSATSTAAGRRPRGRPALGDVIGGLTVVLILIPQALAYAELAGMPPERGLFAAAIPLLVAAPLASSPYLQTGPVAVTALLTFGALSTLAPVGSDEYIHLGLLLAFLVGLVRIAVGLSGAGVIAYLMSRPMLMGFMPGAAFVIASSQFPAAVGADPPQDGILAAAGWTVTHPDAWKIGGVLAAALTVALVLGGRRAHPLFPGVLLAVVGATLAGALGWYDGTVVGEIPVSLPPVSVDLPWADVVSLLVPATLIALVGFAEPASIARSLAAKDRMSWDADREFVSQGAANVAAGLTGGFPIGGSFSRSALNRLAGARTTWSGAITGAGVLVLLPAAVLLEDLPKAVLSGIILAAVVPLIKLRPLLSLARHSPPAAMVGLATFAATVGFAPRVERGVLVGVVLSVLVHLWRELHSDVSVWVDGDGVVHIRPQGVLWFGAAQRLEDELAGQIGRHPEAARFVLHLDGVGRLDVTAALSMRAVLADAARAGVEVVLDGVRPTDRRLVDGIVLADEEPVGM